MSRPQSPKICHWPLRITVLMALCLLPVQGMAIGLDLLGGAFSLEAKTSAGSGSVSNIGAYRISLSQPVIPKLEAAIGYTLMASDMLGGDLSYGLDFTASYFPTSRSSNTLVETPQIQYEIRDIWMPYGGVGFHQRQFQSVRTHYAGFGAHAGVLRDIRENLRFKAELRYVGLAGPSGSTGSELTIVGGVRIPLK
jgi:hypothetical protein